MVLEYCLEVDLLDFPLRTFLCRVYWKNLSVTAPFLPLPSFKEVLLVAFLVESPNGFYAGLHDELLA